jgi:hypothetical protein
MPCPWRIPAGMYIPAEEKNKTRPQKQFAEAKIRPSFFLFFFLIAII